MTLLISSHSIIFHISHLLSVSLSFSLELASLLRGAMMVECVRVQMLKGVFRVLTASVSRSCNEISMVDLLSHVTDMQEDRKSQLNAHSPSEAHAERQVTQTHAIRIHWCV